MNKKKIGIMSMQRIVNYGSFLQAYALRKMIKSLGYDDVKFLDYKFEKEVIPPTKKVSLFQRICSHKNILSYIRKRRFKLRFRNKYQKFLETLDVREKDYSKDVDTLVIGSDEVFNCMQVYPVGYSRGLFGKGYEKSNVISYAACFGHTDLEDLKKVGIDKEVAEMLRKFSAISVRDENSKMVVEALVPKKEVEIHLDPVLVGDFGEAFDLPVKLKNYIIVYAYSGRLSPSEERAIRKFARVEGKRIVSIGFYQKCADINMIVEPLEVLAYFKKADFVITDTFHGTIFSIKTNTKFCSIVRDSNRNKLGYLLKKMKCESQLIEDINKLDEVYHRDFDFAECNRIILKETKNSKDYLKKNL